MAYIAAYKIQACLNILTFEIEFERPQKDRALVDITSLINTGEIATEPPGIEIYSDIDSDSDAKYYYNLVMYGNRM